MLDTYSHNYIQVNLSDDLHDKFDFRVNFKIIRKNL